MSRVMGAIRPFAALAGLCMLGPCVLAPRAEAAQVQVAVAANFTAPMKKIAAGFEQDTGHTAVLAFGATGKFYAQIGRGAPFEFLVAADERIPARLESDGLAVRGSRFTYATGRLVLWSPKPGLVDARGQALGRAGLMHVAIANPRASPYGAAAVEVLGKMGLLSRLEGKLVQGENIAQAYQYVSSGNAQLGLVALSQVYGDGRHNAGSAWIVPAALHQPIRQDAVLLTRGSGNPAARALGEYLKSERAIAVIRSYGYER